MHWTDQSSHSTYLQETPRDSLRRCQDRLDTYRRLPDSLRWCQDHMGTCTRLLYSLRRC
ncbi:hypothetical protein DPMN_191222 [Dreissena polymorpha]|uniref:Uncharacterized protein n=1 Tax=Dreissena polymorpha TaxID=45954 RepID=A0A9D4BCX5_DREPO|nr:hypothetical protein DPMN_191222 [Dreissena polymorpha]